MNKPTLLLLIAIATLITTLLTGCTSPAKTAAELDKTPLSTLFLDNHLVILRQISPGSWPSVGDYRMAILERGLPQLDPAPTREQTEQIMRREIDREMTSGMVMFAWGYPRTKYKSESGGLEQWVWTYDYYTRNANDRTVRNIDQVFFANGYVTYWSKDTFD